MQRDDDEKKIPKQEVKLTFIGSSNKKIEYMSFLSAKNYGYIDNFEQETRDFSYNNYDFSLFHIPFEALADKNKYVAECLIICPTTKGEITRIYKDNLTQETVKTADIYIVVDSVTLSPAVLKEIEEEAFSLGMEVREVPNTENRTTFLDAIIKTSQLAMDERKTVHQDNIKEYKEFKEGPQRRAAVSEFFKDHTLEDPVKIINEYVGGAKENKNEENNQTNLKPKK